MGILNSSHTTAYIAQPGPFGAAAAPPLSNCLFFLYAHICLTFFFFFLNQLNAEIYAYAFVEKKRLYLFIKEHNNMSGFCRASKKKTFQSELLCKYPGHTYTYVCISRGKQYFWLMCQWVNSARQTEKERERERHKIKCILFFLAFSSNACAYKKKSLHHIRCDATRPNRTNPSPYQQPRAFTYDYVSFV